MTPRVIDDRFEIVSLHAHGGMADVYRAIDRTTEMPVALKVIAPRDMRFAERFLREARTLRRLDHPRVVRYLAHGWTNSQTDELYIAMEWLDGEDLASRLIRGPLHLLDAAALSRYTIQALSAAHDHGLIHRDLKPSNIFLRQGHIDGATLLDFGVAAMAGGDATQLTVTGAIVGTVGYMAPEQITGGDVDVRADFFALGCVLYECLSGSKAFPGDTPLAVCNRILEQNPVPLSTLTQCPRPAADLVDRLLCKDRTKRPQTCGDILALLEAAIDDDATVSASIGREGTPSAERTLVETLVLRTADANAPLSALAGESGRVSRLPSGEWAIVFRGQGAAIDRAAVLASFALSLRHHLPDAAISIAMPLSDDESAIPGSATDALVRLLAREGAPSPTPIAVDDALYELIERRFVCERRDGTGYLLREKGTDEASVTEPEAPFIGRDREIAHLLSAIEQCTEDRSSRALIVYGEPGMGKTRLCEEVCAALAKREGAPRVWSGRCYEITRAAPYSLIAPLTRRVLRINDADPPLVKQQMVRVALARWVEGAALERVSFFLGGVLGVEFPSSPLAASLREEPDIADRQRRATWINWLQSELAHAPVVIVIDDIQWADNVSLDFVNEALRSLPDRPLCVVAFGRTEIIRRTPRLWSGRRVEEMALRELSVTAQESLIREKIGEHADREAVSRLRERAGGNALYLLGIARAYANGQGEVIPPSLLAMEEARVESLEPESRRVLRACSILGDIVPPRAVAAILGGKHLEKHALARIEDLAGRECLVRSKENPFLGEPSYAFAHSLLREAAYAGLTEEGLRVGHRSAGAWLEREGTADAIVVAEHFRRGIDFPRAVQWYRQAAEASFAAGDAKGVVEIVGSALMCEPVADASAILLMRRASALANRGRQEDLLAACADCEKVRTCSDPGDRQWCRATALHLQIAGTLGDDSTQRKLAGELLALVDAPRKKSVIIAWAQCVESLLARGHRDTANQMGHAVEMAVEPMEPIAGILRGWVLRQQAARAFDRRDLPTVMTANQRAADAFEEAGFLRYCTLARTGEGFAALELGRFEHAREASHRAASTAQALGMEMFARIPIQNMALACARLGRYDEARALLRDRAAVAVARDDERALSEANAYEVVVHYLAGEYAEAIATGSDVVGREALEPSLKAYVHAILALAFRSRGENACALEHALSARSLCDAVGRVEEGEAFIHLAGVVCQERIRHGEEWEAAVTRARAFLAERDAFSLAQCAALPEANQLRVALVDSASHG